MTTYIRLGIQAVASGTGEAGRMIKAAALEVQTRKKHQAAYLFGLSIQEKGRCRNGQRLIPLYVPQLCSQALYLMSCYTYNKKLGRTS